MQNQLTLTYLKQAALSNSVLLYKASQKSYMSKSL